MHEFERWIRDHGMNKADACRWFGISRPTLNRWLKGYPPQPRHLQIIIEKTKGEMPSDTWFPRPRRRRMGVIAALALQQILELGVIG